MNVAVTGATGKLAKHILEENPTFHGVSRKKGDYKTLEEMVEILSKYDVVINSAGYVGEDEDKIWEANVEIPKMLSENLPKEVKLIHISSISVYGKKNIEGFDETSPIEPDTPYAKSKAEGEKYVRRRKNALIVRLGPLFGWHFPEYKKILSLIKKGTLPYISNPNNKIPLVYAKDFAQFIPKLMKISGVVLIACPSATQKELVETVCSILGVKPPNICIPKWLAMSMVKFGILKSLTEEHIRILSVSREFNCKKAKKLGWKPTPLKKALEETVKKMEGYHEGMQMLSR